MCKHTQETHQAFLFIFGTVCPSIMQIPNTFCRACNRYGISVLYSSLLKLTFWSSTFDILWFEKTHRISKGAFKAKWFALVPPSLSAASIAAVFNQPFCLAASFSACPSVCQLEPPAAETKVSLMKRRTGRRRTGALGWGGSKMEELPWLIFNSLLDLTLLKDPLFTWL